MKGFQGEQVMLYINGVEWSTFLDRQSPIPRQCCHFQLRPKSSKIYSSLSVVGHHHIFANIELIYGIQTVQTAQLVGV